MSWNIAPECVSIVVLSIIWIYSRKGNPIPNLKNKLFQACFFMTFSAMATNVVSTWLIYSLNPKLILPAWIITTIYFIATPLMGVVYFYYVTACIYEDTKKIIKICTLFSIPGFLYLLSVLCNPVTGSIFRLSLEEGYTQGGGILSTYFIFYFYCLASVVVVLLRLRNLTSTIRMILLSFPVVAAMVVIIQLAVPDIILTGSAATCALLIIYLFLQNKQISIDYLTGVPNRQELLNMLELKRRKPPKSGFTVIIVSLRNFKQVNDTYGQHKGDALLIALSSFLQKDTAFDKGLLYRYSGDEFAVLIDNIGRGRAEGVAESILKRMNRSWSVKECTCMLSAAVGVVRFPDDANQMEEMINAIEYSVYVAKTKTSQNALCICNAQILEGVKRKNQIVTIMKEYLEQDKFEVFYQPILTMKNHKFETAEALLRIRNSSLGDISPAEFIPIAEETGLIIPITYQVLDKVSNYVRSLQENGIVLTAINVNFSSLQFTQKDLIGRLTEIIRKSRISFSKIKIEITETTLAQSQEEVNKFTSCMHDLGVRIGLDDFGVGFSNLSSVTELPLDTVKLDKSLIWSAMENRRSEIIVKNLTRAFCQLGLTVLAEGVENEEQSQFVEECGCSMIQGFYYAKPMPAFQYEEFMKQQT